MVAPRVDRLVAVDASPAALEVARTNVQAAKVTFVQATPETLPFPDGHFDVIFPSAGCAICRTRKTLREREYTQNTFSSTASPSEVEQKGSLG
jgi:ubiquinone/menaquinone biosynthesis C-methylase UbiE